MNRREQIIIAVTVVVGLYALFMYVARPLLMPKPAAPESPINVGEILALAEAAGPDPAEQRTVERILSSCSRPWPSTIFFPRSWDMDKATTGNRRPDAITDLDPAQYVYSGFMEMNGRKIAIINGIDYQLGEQVDGYLLETIQPEHVILSRDKTRYSIQMQETE